MQPAVPDRPVRPRQDENDPFLSADDVGSFEQGTEFSRWALARYLVGRVIGESVGTTLLAFAIGLLVLGAILEFAAHTTFFAVLVVIFALLVLLVRAAVMAILRGLTRAESYGPYEQRLRAMIDDTHKDTLRELRRVGLPGRTLTLPLLAFRLIGKRRPATLERLRDFEVERAVPSARIDELHMLLRGGLAQGPNGPGPSGTIIS